MAIKFPNFDNSFSGASDIMDLSILAGEYFEAVLIGGTGLIKAFNGTWLEKPVKVWNGSAWVQKPVKKWTGSAWA